LYVLDFCLPSSSVIKPGIRKMVYKYIFLVLNIEKPLVKFAFSWIWSEFKISSPNFFMQSIMFGDKLSLDMIVISLLGYIYLCMGLSVELKTFRRDVVSRHTSDS
jgi:hypothetical protein